jgi:hypothetical protein
MQWGSKKISNSGSAPRDVHPLKRRPKVAHEPTQVLFRGPYIVKECDWQGVVGIGVHRHNRGKGISASFVAPVEMPAVGGGASVHVAALGAPHAYESIQTERVCHQSRGARVSNCYVPQSALCASRWKPVYWLSNATAAMRHVRHALACESTMLDAPSNRSRAHSHRVDRCGHRVPQRFRSSEHQVP